MSRRHSPVGPAELLAEVRGLSGDFDKLSQAVAERVGLSVTELLAMDLLGRNGSIPAGHMAKELHLTTGAITGLVDRLEHAGFVRRMADPADRRRVLVAVTAKEQKISGLYEPLIVGLREAVSEYANPDVAKLVAFIGVLRSVVAQTTDGVRGPAAPPRPQRPGRKQPSTRRSPGRAERGDRYAVVRPRGASKRGQRVRP